MRPPYSLAELDAAADTVHEVVPPTPQYAWPLLARRLGTEVWVKHENHTPTGAFKVRGGLVYLEGLARREPGCPGIVSATRGNHGQSLALAARRHGLGATIVVPHGNSREKNAAMRAFGATLVEHGEDFQAATEHAAALAVRDGLHRVPSFHADLVRGVATAWLEFFQAVPQLDVVFVPIGMGSGLCAAIAARAALGRRMRLVGVVSAHARAYALSLAQGRPVESPVTTQLADGMACRRADQAALDILQGELDHIVQVSDAEVAQAMRDLFACTHNVAEGAGAASFAAAYKERDLPAYQPSSA
jgi:threonine dehydratase